MHTRTSALLATLPRVPVCFEPEPEDDAEGDGWTHAEVTRALAAVAARETLLDATLNDLAGKDSSLVRLRTGVQRLANDVGVLAVSKGTSGTPVETLLMGIRDALDRLAKQ